MDSYMRSEIPMTAPYTTIPTFLKRWAEEIPNNDVLRIYTPGLPVRRITHGELYQKATTLAKGLVRLGIKKDDIVGICGTTSSEYLISLYGVQMTRAKPLNLTIHEKDGADFERMINVIGSCRLLIFDPGHENKTLDIIRQFVSWDISTGKVTRSNISGLQMVLLQSSPEEDTDCFSFDTIYNNYYDDEIELLTLDPEDVAAIVWTSGSTGNPKAVEYTHCKVVTEGYEGEKVFNHAFENKRIQPLVYNDRPFYWIGGFPFTEIITGGTRITQGNLLAFSLQTEVMDYTIEILKKENPDRATLLTSYLNEILARKINGLKIDSILTAGQPVPSNCLEGIGKLFENLVVFYGATEFGLAIYNVYSASTKTTEKYLGGKPAAGAEVKIVGSNGLMVKGQEKGEIFIRTSTGFNGYINNVEKTKAVLTPTGWFKTDDVGHINADGCIEISGRMSDVMQISGWKIAPFYIQSAILKHPYVQNCVVFATKGPDDNIPCAAVQTLPGQNVTEQDLILFTQNEMHIDNDAALLEQLYVPKYFIFLNEIPKTPNGKNDRRQTIDQCAKLLKSRLRVNKR